MAEINKNRHELWQLKQFQALPLDVKIMKSQQRIREWVEHFGVDSVAVSFSGGKDSLIVLDLVRELYPSVEAVFCNTRLEFREILDFVRETPNVTWVQPDLNYRQVIKKYGYAVVSKEISHKIEQLQNKPSFACYNKNINGIMADGSKTKFKLSDQWQYLLNSGIKISAKCCDVSKKRPLYKYAKKKGLVYFVGTMACESMLRRQQWLKAGCNAFDNKKQVSAPISFWNQEDIWEYIKLKKLKYSKIYDMGYVRTGCAACPLGAHLDSIPNRYQCMQKTHPQLWRYCMRPWDQGGLGLREVLEILGIPYENFLL